MDAKDGFEDDFLSGVWLKTFCLGPPMSPELLLPMSNSAVYMMLKGYEIQGGKKLLDRNSEEAALNSASLGRIELSAGKTAASRLEEAAVVAAATFRDFLQDNPGLAEALKSTDHALDFQTREREAVLEAAKLASKEIFMKDAQTYLEVCDLIANLIARKASDILARRPESLPRRTSSVGKIKRRFKMLLGKAILAFVEKYYGGQK